MEWTGPIRVAVAEIAFDASSPTPGYRQIADQIAARIDAGSLRPADRLPTERGLSAHLGVSRMTVRQAFDVLEHRGLVERTVGRGTFVRAPRLDVVLTDRVVGFTELSERAGLTASAIVQHAGVAIAPPPVAAALRLAAGARAARITRIRFAEGLAVTLEDTWLPDEVFPGIADGDLTGSLYALMAGPFGRPPVRALETLEPTIARQADIEALGVVPRTPLMQVERIGFDADGVAVEYAIDRHRGDRARFTVEVAPRG